MKINRDDKFRFNEELNLKEINKKDNTSVRSRAL